MLPATSGCALPARRRSSVLLLILASGVLGARVRSQTSAQEVRFNRDIRPILAAACFPCHGPDPGTRKAGLRLDREADWFTGRDHGTVVVKGKPLESLLHQRITNPDADEVMPPPTAPVQLQPAQKDLLRRWIEQGAPWQDHWAFLPLERPAVPAVADAGWVRNPVDAFVLASMQAAGLQPAPEADRHVLARRLGLTLIGLPPTQEQVAAFVQDARPDAYERLVDELLASPHYGEHRARYWLDAARYADTHGNHFDNYREMWPYRDWVIQAFADNQRFDQFTVEQLAGDLLPQPTPAQRIATGFHRCNMTTNEGGTIEEENLVGYARDRVETTSWVWLGLTANCAACHDHKFDPISQRDFYALSAYFTNTTQPGLDGNIKDSPPILRLPRPEDRPRAAELPALRQAAEAERERLRSAARREFDAWLATATPADWDQELARDPAPAQVLPLVGPGPGGATAAPVVAWDANGPFGPAARAVDWPDPVDAATSGGFDTDQPFAIDCWVKVAKGAPEGAIFGRMDEHGDCRGFNLWLAGDEFGVHLIHRWPDDALKVRTAGSQVKHDTWQHVCITYDGTRRAAGLQILVGGRASAVQVDQDALRGTTRTSTPFTLARVGTATASIARLFTGTGEGPAGYTKCADEGGSIALTTPTDVAYGANGKFRHLAAQSGTIRFDNGTFGDPIPGVRKAGYRKSGTVATGLASHVWLQRIRFHDRVIPTAAIARQAMATTLRDLLAAAKAERDAEAVDAVFQVLAAANAALTAAAAKVQALADEARMLDERANVTHVQQEKDGPAMAYVLLRGEYDKRGEQVGPGVFTALHAQAPDAPKNRLGLAQWLVSPANALTPRVLVNRLWQEVFGTGIVRTSEDFGTMGEAPSHPELLEWLACEFRSDWDYQRLLKLLVTSATFRQSAAASAAAIAVDPGNRLLARGPRFRLDAEVVRDYALAVSGLLVPTVGGPSVKPYQPDGVWEAVGMRESNTKEYRQDHGPALYRRSLYSFWKRMAPPAALEILNAPNRETSCLRRERTNTPMQALVTLNDPQFVEAARVLAEQVLRQPREQQVAAAGRRILLRPFTPTELALVQRRHAGLLAHYATRADDARALLTVGERQADPSLPATELAAMTMLCNLLLNLDEVLNQ